MNTLDELDKRMYKEYGEIIETPDIPCVNDALKNFLENFPLWDKIHIRFVRDALKDGDIAKFLAKTSMDIPGIVLSDAGLLDATKNYHLSADDMIERALYHELGHAILELAAYHEIISERPENQNEEDAVDFFSSYFFKNKEPSPYIGELVDKIIVEQQKDNDGKPE